MSTGSTRGAAYADLVGGLLDARVDQATERFDAELAAAVGRGAVTADAARALRFWQRAALRAVVDHARAVLPAVLTALDAAREEGAGYVGEAQRAFDDATGEEPAETAETPSTRSVEPPTSLMDRRQRLLVAGLTTVTPAATTQTDRP